MNLTKSLSLALGCAGIFAFTASATSFVSDTFKNISGTAAPDVWTPAGYWGVSGNNDTSRVVEGDAARSAFSATSTPITNATDSLVVALNTEGDILSRDVGNISFAGTPLYVDMMVKFVLSEEMPEVTADSKLAICASVADSNLYVRVSNDGSGAALALDWYRVENVKVDPEQWYRVTVECSFDAGGWDAAMFRIKLNGGEYLNSLGGWDIDLGAQGEGDCTYFFSASGSPNNTTLYSIDFQGTGFIDELVVTDDLPYFAEGTGEDTYFAGDPNKPVDSVAYNAWIAKYNVSPILPAMWNAFVLNVNPGDGTSIAGLKILSIEPIGANAVITIGAGLENAALASYTQYANQSNLLYPNGKLTLQKAATLGAWEPDFEVNLASPTGVTVGADGKITVPMTGFNFLKASIE